MAAIQDTDDAVRDCMTDLAPTATPASEGTLSAGSDLLEGAMKVATPLAIAVALLDLPGTVLVVAGSYVAATIAGKTADLAGATSEAKRLSENVVGALAALGMGSEELAWLAARGGDAFVRGAKATVEAWVWQEADTVLATPPARALSLGEDQGVAPETLQVAVYGADVAPNGNGSSPSAPTAVPRQSGPTSTP